MFDLNGNEIFTEEKLEMYISVQFSVPRKYNPKDYFGGNALAIEQQSAQFLRNYLAGTCTFTPEAFKLLSEYLHILRHSKYDDIKNQIKQAFAKYEEDKKKLKKAAIQKRKDEEAVRASAASGFSILNKNRVARNLTSSQLLLLGELLGDVKEYSTSRLKDKLRNYSALKIRRTFAGEIPADEDFLKLVTRYGTHQDKSYVNKRLKSYQPLAKTSSSVVRMSKDTYTKTAPKKSKIGRIKSLIGNACKKVKRAAIITGIVLLSAVGGKSTYDVLNRSFSEEKDHSPNIENTTSTTNGSIDSTRITTTESSEQDVPVLTTAQQNLEKAYKNRFDSSLEILIGAEQRDALYAEVDQLAHDGKIEFKDGTTREWYAHAFTMYDKIAPYSAENQLIKKLRSGEDISKQTIHDLVIKSGRNGSGVHGTGTYSAFNHADAHMQQKHIANQQNVKNARLAINAATLAR